MGNTVKRAIGTAKEVGGKVAKKVGQAVGSERLEAEGRATELEGHSEKEHAKLRERVEGTIQETAGEIQRRAGKLLDDEKMEAKGVIRKASGRVRKQANR